MFDTRDIQDINVMRIGEILRKSKYIKRTGGPGNYKYWYRDKKTGKVVEGKKPENNNGGGEGENKKLKIVEEANGEGFSIETKEEGKLVWSTRRGAEIGLKIRLAAQSKGMSLRDYLDVSNKESNAKQLAEEKKVDEEKREQSDLGGFGDNLSARDKALAIKILNKQKRFDGGAVITVKEKIKELIKNGELELKVREENKIKDMPRRSYNRATNEEQARHALKQKEAGKVKVYMVSGYDLGKTAYDYAEYILSKKG